MEIYTSGDILKRFDLSRESIRTYSIEFSRYLSPGANPPKGHQRNFTYEDLQVFALIVEMKTRGATYEQIHTELQIGQRGVVPSPSPIAKKEDSQSVMYQRELSAVKAQYEKTLSELRTERDKALGRAEAYEQQNDTLQERIDELQEQIIQLRIKLARYGD